MGGLILTPDPVSNNDFQTIISSNRVPELYPGHECYSIPSPPSNIGNGSNATLQIRYIAEGDSDTNQTFYACADITYIPLNEFTGSIPCFNVSIEDFETTSSATAAATASPTGSTSASAATVTGAAAQSTATSEASGGSPSHDGLSGGAIAGTVIGCVAGAALIAGALFMIYRRRRQGRKRRQVAALRMNDLASPTKRTASETSNE